MATTLPALDTAIAVLVLAAMLWAIWYIAERWVPPEYRDLVDGAWQCRCGDLYGIGIARCPDCGAARPEEAA